MKWEGMTKGEAAQALRCSEKTIDRYSAGEAPRIRRRIENVPGRPPRPLFHKGDIEKLIAQQPGETALVPIAHHQAPQPQGPAVNLIALPAEQFERLLQSVQPPAEEKELPLSELRHKVYLTTSEAVRYSGLSRSELAEMAGEGKIKRLGLGRHKYSRASLDGLC